MFERLLRKIYRTFFPVKVIEKIWPGVNIGNEVFIDPSCILSVPPSGKITLAGNNYIGRQVEMGPIGHIEIGIGSSIQDRCIILGDVEIGNYCIFASNVYISSGRHYYNYKPNFYIKDQDEMVSADHLLSKTHSKKVSIGDDCWLGINVVIMSGITIGRGCVVGANSVVTKDLDPFSIVAGSPAKLIKKRLDFIPKSVLKSGNENDLPNFYKGFFIDVKNLKENNLQDGIIASSHFTLYLRSDSKKISLNIKKIVQGPVTLIYNDQEAKIETNEFVSLTFNSCSNNYHHFLIKEIPDRNKKCVCVKTVEISN